MTDRGLRHLVIRHDSGSCAFVAEDEGRRLGELTYSHGPENTLSIDHVFVSPPARGAQVARKLVEAALACRSALHLTN